MLGSQYLGGCQLTVCTGRPENKQIEKRCVSYKGKEGYSNNIRSSNYQKSTKSLPSQYFRWSQGKLLSNKRGAWTILEAEIRYVITQAGPKLREAMKKPLALFIPMKSSTLFWMMFFFSITTIPFLKNQLCHIILKNHLRSIFTNSQMRFPWKRWKKKEQFFCQKTEVMINYKI